MKPTSIHEPVSGSGEIFSSDGVAMPAVRYHAVALWLGIATAVAGGVIMFGWVADMPVLKGLFPHQVQTKANTALCFILLGGALALKAWGRLRSLPDGFGRLLASGCAVLATLVGSLTLMQYAISANFGIDEILFKETAEAVDTVHPGRMALPTALSFLLLGLALLVLDHTRGKTLLPWLVLPTSVIAGLAFLGHLYGVPFLASFGPFTKIAAPTGLFLLLLGLGILHIGSGRLVARLWRSISSIGFVAALLLLIIMGGAVFYNTRLLMDSNRQVNHTHEVLGKLAATLSAVQDVETGARGYLLTGDRSFLEPAASAPARARDLLHELQGLTADNPIQAARLERLEELVEKKVASSERQIAMREQGDKTGAQKLVATGAGRDLMDAIRREVAVLQEEENRLLRERLARVEGSTQKTLLTLSLGMVTSVGLLITVFQLLRREVKARTRLTAELRRSEESLAVTLNSIGDGVLATDKRGRITRMNRVAEQLTGWARDEARGRPVAEVFHIINEETRQPGRIPVDDVLMSGEIRELANHTALIARDGTERAIADSAAPIRDAAGRILGVVLVFRDVTAEHAARQALHESEERYRTLFNSIDEGFCIIEMIFDGQGRPADYRFLEINQSFERQTGLRDALGKRMLELAPQHEAHWFETYGRIALTGEAIRFQNRAEQLHRTYDVYAFRFGDPQSRRVGILFNDITERERVQAELDRFFSLSLDFLCIAGMDGRFKRASSAVTDILGWTVEEFLAMPYLDQIHPDDRASAAREVERQQAGHKVMQYECRFRHKDGSWRVLSWRSTPYGSLMYASARDVTETKRTEAQVRELNSNLARHAAQMEEANKELESFSYSVSHDLRAPLRHIQGYVEMLAREAGDGLSAKAQRYLKTIAAAAREMGELIDDLLAFSRMGRTEMREAELDLDGLIREVRSSLEPSAQGRNIRWTVAPLPRVCGDPAMLRQVFVNLLGNAIKYTRLRDPAEIEIGTAGVEGGRVVVFVRDNGAGFDMKYADKLFGVFQRLHRADEFEGTGIGLASVRRIITRHGGRTWAEARVNAGATFFLTLTPATAVQSSTPAAP